MSLNNDNSNNSNKLGIRIPLNNNNLNNLNKLGIRISLLVLRIVLLFFRGGTFFAKKWVFVLFDMCGGGDEGYL